MAYLNEILYLLGDKKRALPWLVGLFLFSSLIDLIGLGLIAPYTLLIINPELFVNSSVYAFLEKIGFSFDQKKIITVLSIVLFGIFLFKTISLIYINKVIIVFSLQLQTDLRSILMGAYQNLNYSEYLRRNSSEYIIAIQSYTGQFSNGVLQSSLRILSEGITVVVIVIMLAFNNGPALLLLALLLGGMSFSYDSFFRNRVKEYGKGSNKYAKLMLQGIHEGIEGLKEIRVLGCEKYFHNVVKKSAKQFAGYNSKAQIIKKAPRYLLEFMLLTFVVLLVNGTYWFGYNADELIPTLSLFGMAATRLLPSANALISGFSQIRFGRNATSLLYKDLKHIESSDFIINDVPTSILPEKFKILSLNNICFQYQDAKQLALNNLTLSIHEGESIGLVGASGSGKTTLVDTMLGLLTPQSGSILFNNELLQDKLAHWRSNVAYLPQQVLLIDNSLRCNVALGVPVNEIDEECLNKAIEQARLSELVRQLPKGFDTILGERGIRLSGGQRQRVALARAFYHGRNVLIMDEATSSLDNETEKEIVEEIKRLKGQKTLIVIAHRLTTVQHCDRIYRLENGKIINEGSYASVIGS
jgi:ATP-binding cassette, subfamily B, bacterial PglK